MVLVGWRFAEYLVSEHGFYLSMRQSFINEEIILWERLYSIDWDL